MKNQSLVELLTAIVLTKDEEPNIGRCLQGLAWVPRVLIVDSFSSDRTKDIAASFPNTIFVQREFDSFASQCNHALSLVETPWVLSLDADYVVTPQLAAEIASLSGESADGFRAGFTYCVAGRALRASLYPARTVLYRKSMARYDDEGHGHRVLLAGSVRNLTNRILHDDRKPLGRWLRSQIDYAEREADYLETAPPSKLRAMDRLRRWVIPAPAAVAAYVLVAKGCVLDGWPGWYYAMQRSLAELLIALALLDRRLKHVVSVKRKERR